MKIRARASPDRQYLWKIAFLASACLPSSLLSLLWFLSPTSPSWLPTHCLSFFCSSPSLPLLLLRSFYPQSLFTDHKNKLYFQTCTNFVKFSILIIKTSCAENTTSPSRRRPNYLNRVAFYEAGWDCRLRRAPGQSGWPSACRSPLWWDFSSLTHCTMARPCQKFFHLNVIPSYDIGWIFFLPATLRHLPPSRPITVLV